MANDFYTPEQAAKVAVNMVADGSYLSALVSRNFENDLLGGGGKGRTVNVKIPTALVAHNRGIDDVTNKIILDQIAEATVPVTLGRHTYNAVGLSEGDLNLALTDFSSQVLSVQTDAVVAEIEHMVRAALLAEAYDTTLAYDEAAPEKTFTRIRKALRDRGLNGSDLNVVVGSEVYANLLDAKAITDASASGSTEALREGNVGKVRGFTVVEDADIPEGDIIAFHRLAYTLATRAPQVPKGAPFGAMVTDRGFQMRYLRDYDADVTQDRSIVGTFTGIAKMPLYRIERTHDTGAQGDGNFAAGSAEAVEVAGGAVFRMSISDTEPV